MTSPKILIIDDESTLVELLQVNFEFEGFSVSKAADGIEGQEKIRRELPDLILLDVRMPELDGFELCRRLKEDPATRDIPVVMVSAYAQQAQVERGLAAGAAAYIKKPFDVMELVETVKKILKRSP